MIAKVARPRSAAGDSGRAGARGAPVDLRCGGWVDLLYDVRVSNLWYLLIAIGLSCVGLAVLWARNRPPAASPRSSVEEFHHKMRALAPDDPTDRRRDGEA